MHFRGVLHKIKVVWNHLEVVTSNSSQSWRSDGCRPSPTVLGKAQGIVQYRWGRPWALPNTTGTIHRLVPYCIESTGSVQSWLKGYCFVVFEISAAELLHTFCRDSAALLLPCHRGANLQQGACKKNILARKPVI